MILGKYKMICFLEGFLIHTYLICIAYNLCSGNIVEEGIERRQGPEGQEFICEAVSA